MKRLAAALTLAAWAAVAAPVGAESVDAQVSRLAKESHAKYKAGDYAAAADLLFQAYELKPDPTLLFNVAKTYEKANNVDQAIRFYQRYLDQQDADPKMMRQASRALEKLQALDAEQKKQAADQKAKDDADRKAQADALAEQQRQLAEQQKKQEEAAKQLELARQNPPPPPERPSKAPGIVLTTVGVVAAAGGLVFGLSAQSEANTEKGSRVLGTKTADVSIAQNRAHYADACYGVGAVAGTVGIVLLIRALRAPSAEAAPASPAPASTPDPTPAAPAAAPAPSSTGPSAMILPHGVIFGWGGTL